MNQDTVHHPKTHKKVMTRLDDLIIKHKIYIQKYGYPRVMSEYHPHLTLLRFVDGNIAEQVANKYNNNTIEISNSIVKEIAIVQGGEHGTVTKFIKKFRLEQ